MISLIVEAVVRSVALGVILWLALALTRSRNPHLHKMVWSTMLLASLIIPFMMRAHVTPALQAPDYVLTLRGVGHAGESTHWSPVWSSVVAFYLLTAFTLLWRFAGNLVRMWRIRRIAPTLGESWTEGLDVRVTPSISSPATFGSTILFPEEFKQWSSQKLRAVLAHERSHVTHWDCYVLWLARLHTSK